jgi:molybdopterin/thiamine biosynthesis adenylyltransferase
MLSAEDMERYRRQMTLIGWGEEGQSRLKAARVVVAGAGGLGSAILPNLAAVGVGNIRIVDSDYVELDNLNRQVLYGSKDVGRSKAMTAEERIRELNPSIAVEGIADRITERNVHDLVGGRLIVDALDNLQARFLINAVAIERHLPLFHGAVYGFEGRATTVIPGRTACLGCVYREVIPGTVPVVGVTPAIIGAIQATEVIKYVVGIGELLVNRLLMYDGSTMRFTEMVVKRDPQCSQCRGRAE